MLGQLKSMAERGSIGLPTLAFADSLAMQVGDLCRKLALEQAGQYAQSFAEVSKQRDDLRMENAKLKSDLKAFQEGICTPRVEIQLEESEAQQMSSEREPASQMDDLQMGVCSRTASSLLGRAYTHTETDPMEEMADQHMLRKVFKEVDRRKVKRVSAEDIVAHMEGMGDPCLVSLDILRAAFVRINKSSSLFDECHVHDNMSMNAMRSWSLKSESSTDAPTDELTFDGFRAMILRDTDDIVGAEAALVVHEVRQFYIRLAAEQVIVQKTRVQKDALNTTIKESNVPCWVEPSIGFVILFNAGTIGLSQDFAPGSDVWTVVECTCTALFVIEVVIKLHYEGFCGHFFGHGWAWNWFDFFICVIAVTDTSFVLSDAFAIHDLPTNLGGITIVRLVRLLRIARLVRLLRMKFFKELTLMVQGVITGLKTLCWAFVFLLVLVYILGVLIKQLMDPKSFGDSCADENTCSHSENILIRNYSLLFSTVFRSMFTVFRCLIGDCSASDGVPLAPHLMDSLGVLFTMGYLLVTCFVLFGVFNLVMAIFVENTLEAARISQQKRHQARRSEDIRVAQELRDIVLRICTRRTRPRAGSRRYSKPLIGRLPSVKTLHTRRFSLPWLWRRIFRQQVEEHDGSVLSNPNSSEEEGDTMQMTVTRDIFEEVMDDPKVMQILDDLEISVTDHAKLFDIIDSNGSGQLDIVEIIEGLMKLRGPADKGDVVCSALMVRSVQRELKRLEMEMILRHKALQEAQNRSLGFLQVLQIQSVQPIPGQHPKRAEMHAAL